ncbi:Hypothetical protein D9617_14g077030 [Elsinoe fawcettii]|nr:Hypothetical protein D9617_14g077030 [Elsinoe fawcettii]
MAKSKPTLQTPSSDRPSSLSPASDGLFDNINVNLDGDEARFPLPPDRKRTAPEASGQLPAKRRRNEPIPTTDAISQDEPDQKPTRTSISRASRSDQPTDKTVNSRKPVTRLSSTRAADAKRPATKALSTPRPSAPTTSTKPRASKPATKADRNPNLYTNTTSTKSKASPPTTKKSGSTSHPVGLIVSPGYIIASPSSDEQAGPGSHSPSATEESEFGGFSPSPTEVAADILHDTKGASLADSVAGAAAIRAVTGPDRGGWKGIKGQAKKKVVAARRINVQRQFERDGGSLAGLIRRYGAIDRLPEKAAEEKMREDVLLAIKLACRYMGGFEGEGEEELVAMTGKMAEEDQDGDRREDMKTVIGIASKWMNKG